MMTLSMPKNDSCARKSRRRDRHRRDRRCLLVCAAQASALDREALKRGNSAYFPDRVVPMLPERISNDLCSLREGEDRPALAVRMIIFKRRPQNQPPVPPGDDQERRQTLLSASTGCDRWQTCDDKPPGHFDGNRCLKPLMACLCRSSSAVVTSASRLNSTCPNARSC
jgi:hypothetical protein